MLPFLCYFHNFALFNIKIHGLRILHWWRLSKSRWKQGWSLASSMTLEILQSSEKSAIVLPVRTTSGKSLIRTTKKNGPKMEPIGTPGGLDTIQHSSLPTINYWNNSHTTVIGSQKFQNYRASAVKLNDSFCQKPWRSLRKQHPKLWPVDDECLPFTNPCCHSNK